MIIKLNKQEVLDAIVKSFPILQGQEGVNLTFIDDGAEITLGEESTPTPVEQSSTSEDKPAPKKRKRRTKAQIEADEAKAKAEAETPDPEPEKEDSDDSVFAEPKSDRMDMQEPEGLGGEDEDDEESIFG